MKTRRMSFWIKTHRKSSKSNWMDGIESLSLGRRWLKMPLGVMEMC